MSNKFTESKSRSVPNVDHKEYLFVITAKRSYTPETEDELELYQNQVLYVLEETDNNYLCHAPQEKVTRTVGYVKKEIVEKQVPFVVLAGILTSDQLNTDDSNIMTCYKSDKVLIVARCKDGYLYCKRLGSSTVEGRVVMEKLFIEGDIYKLPTLSEYVERSLNTKSATSSPVLSRLHNPQTRNKELQTLETKNLSNLSNL
eukprot:NODE_301_length_11418_cov_0.342521.p6 type:complete len:201 gc:universal NODE_301_length_11418_cov_0.342521:10986-10384(-)